MKDFQKGFVFFREALSLWGIVMNGSNLKFQEVIYEYLFWEHLSGFKED